jgi:hypothetical protein
MGGLGDERLGHCLSNHQSAHPYLPASLRPAHHLRRDPFPLGGAFWAAAQPPHLGGGPGVFALPRFVGTTGHSDFSHGVLGDFTSSAYTPRCPPRRAGPYETSRGHAGSFPAVPPAPTFGCPGSPSISFAQRERARLFLLDLADRFAFIGYGPAVRRKPSGSHLAVSTLSCAFLYRGTFCRPTPPFSLEGRRPVSCLTFGYEPRLETVRQVFHLLGACTARRTPARR